MKNLAFLAALMLALPMFVFAQSAGPNDGTIMEVGGAFSTVNSATAFTKAGSESVAMATFMVPLTPKWGGRFDILPVPSQNKTYQFIGAEHRNRLSDFGIFRNSSLKFNPALYQIYAHAGVGWSMGQDSTVPLSGFGAIAGLGFDRCETNVCLQLFYVGYARVDMLTNTNPGGTGIFLVNKDHLVTAVGIKFKLGSPK